MSVEERAQRAAAQCYGQVDDVCGAWAERRFAVYIREGFAPYAELEEAAREYLVARQTTDVDVIRKSRARLRKALEEAGK